MCRTLACAARTAHTYYVASASECGRGPPNTVATNAGNGLITVPRVDGGRRGCTGSTDGGDTPSDPPQERMSDSDRRLRVRALLDAYFPVLIVVVILLAAALGFWTYQVHAVEEVDTEERVVTQWSESTSYEHGSLVVNDSVPFAQGERVENRPIYYTTISDDLDVTYRYEHTAETDLEVSTDVRLRFRSTDGEEIFWEVTEPLASGGPQSISADVDHTVNATVNIESVLNTIEDIEEQLGTEGSVEITVIAVSGVEGTVDGDPVDQSHESMMTLAVSQSSFRVLETETIEENHQQSETIEVPQEPSTFAVFGSLLAFSASLTMLGALAFVRQRGYISLSEEEAELLELRQQEQEFSDWITTGTFPSERDYEATIIVDDLEGLVDVAIDTNKRVIKDEQLGVSTVLDSDYAYIYVRPDSPASDWLFNQADTTMEEMNEFQF